MIGVIFGIMLFCFAVFACIPKELFGLGLGWWNDVLLVLKGALPVLAVLVGAFSILVGVADIRDKREVRLDEEAALKAEKEARSAEKATNSEESD